MEDEPSGPVSVFSLVLGAQREESVETAVHRTLSFRGLDLRTWNQWTSPLKDFPNMSVSKNWVETVCLYRGLEAWKTTGQKEDLELEQSADRDKGLCWGFQSLVEPPTADHPQERGQMREDQGALLREGLEQVKVSGFLGVSGGCCVTWRPCCSPGGLQCPHGQ